VIGLQTALSLLESGYDVTIVAKHWPEDESNGSIDYTSTKYVSFLLFFSPWSFI
jgi:glycine/D-amino acid oxidase-like deaminating enzyme